MSEDTGSVRKTDLLPAAAALPDFAAVEARVSPDAMEARLSITPVEGASGELTVEHLRAALAAAGVARGHVLSALKDAAADWNANPRAFETQVVARGADAVREKPGALRIAVRCLTEPGDIKAVRASKFFWEVAALAPKFQRVDPGTVVARRAPGTESLLGYTVYGAAVEPGPPEGGAPGSENILEKDNVYIAGNTYSAAATGIVYAGDDGLPRVIPLDFNGVVEVRIAQNLMSAELAALPAGERGTMPSEEYVRELIRSKGVAFGVNKDELRVFMARISKGIAAQEKTVVATGLPAVKGDDGHVEFCFNTESSPAPAINPDGSADYKSISIVTAVGAGTVLARLYPPSKGTQGMDILGRVIKARDGVPAALPVGANTAIPNGDQTSLISLMDGIVSFDGTAVSVVEGYAIPGNVDYSTGNISYERTIAINGDVKSGFEVNCGGDLQVNGLIEDSRVTVKGNVLCRYGFVGTGKGVIDAGGDVNLTYMKNQTLISQGNVNIAKEAINCNILARKSIKIYGHSLSAAGGTLISTESIVVKTVGNISGIKTTLQIDPEPEFVDEMLKMTAAVEQHRSNIKKLTQSLETMPASKKQDKELVRKLKTAVITTQQQILALEESMRALHVAMYKFENSFIRIDRCAYPGTVIKIGPRKMEVTDILTGGRTIRMVEQEIKVS